MNKDCGIPLAKLHVDGIMTTNNLLMQLQVSALALFFKLSYWTLFQADITGIPVIRAHSQDVTSLGVAMAAGMAKGVEVWDINSEERELVPSDTFLPTSTEDGKVECKK